MSRTFRSLRGLSAALLVLSGAMLVSVLASATTAASPEPVKPNKYIGAQKCKTCHASDETGNQFAALSKMKHAHAWEALATDAAKAAAKAKGIDDPQAADACVKCHVTAFGVDEKEIGKGFDKKMGVQCESCHGPGDAHMKARLAAAASAAEGAKVEYKGVPADEIIASPPTATCTGCHNSESPTFKSFCDCKARKEVRHLNPLRQRTDEEKKKLSACGCPDGCECKTTCCKAGACTELAK
jgi:hypothetical protein